MTGQVAPMLWYLLCAVVFTVFPWSMVFTIHRQRMKALEILRIYAEKGIEPPPGIAEPLMRTINPETHKRARPERSRQFERFAYCLFTASAAAGVAWWWRADMSGGWAWIFWIAAIVACSHAAGAVASLVAALTSPRD